MKEYLDRLYNMSLDNLNLSIPLLYIDKGEKMTIKQLQEYCHKVAVEHGWHYPQENVKVKIHRNPLEIAALFHSEISEFVEEIRLNRNINTLYHTTHESDRDYQHDKPIGPAIELADLVIRVLDYCEAEEIDLEKMIMIKMKYNETRPYRHGGKKA